MRKDPTDWRNGFRIWKETGESPWEAGRRKELPEFVDGKEKINYKRWDNAELTSYSVPFIKNKRVTLTNAGRATGAVLSTNLLDSLADNAVRGGLNPKTMIGISTKETTLGNPTDTKSAFNLSSGIRRLFNGKYPGTEQHINYWGDALNEREDVINYHKGHQTDDPKSGGKSVLQEAAEFFSKHPDSYNPRQPGYAKLVKKISDEVWLSPEIKRWYNAWTTKNKLKNSRWNRVNPLLKESKFNLPKYYLGTEGDDIEELIRKRLEQRSDNTSVQRQEPVLPIKRQYGKVVDPKLVERKLQQQPVIKQGNTYKVKPRPLTFAGRVAQAVGGDWIKADITSAGVSLLPVIGQLNGALDFGYDLNNSAHNMLDVEANTNTAMSGIALLPFVRNGLKMLKGKTWAVKLRNLYDKVMTSSNSADDVNKALKTGKTADAIQDAHGLDWSSWSKGGPISRAHLQEYADIEQNAKRSGTWLLMPDGSLWDGDPHSWVLLMSKDGQKILPKRYFHGSDDFYKRGDVDVTPEVKGTKSIWMSSNPYVARTYTTGDHKVYELGIPKNAKVHSVDANGRNWRTVLLDENGNWLTTNDVASNPQYLDGIVQIKNVWDPGSSLVTKKSKYYITPTQEEKNMTWSEFSRIHQIGDDIITNGVPRKSLLYNNGDFNLSDPNIYKMLTPGILAGAGYGIYNKYAE